MDSIRFHFDNVHAGFTTCTGLLRLTERGLRCEYRLDVGGVGLKSESREVNLSLDEVDSIEFKRGWFGAKAIVRPNTLKVLDRFPASNDDSITLRFLRRDRSRAEVLISELNLKLSERRLEQAGEEPAAGS